MKTIAAIEADFDESPLGTVSRLIEDLAGETVVRRTVQRVLRCQRVDSIHLIVPGRQRSVAEQQVEGLPVRVETHDAAAPPGRELTRAARKWSLDGWRGGVGGACWFDEQTHPAVLGALGRKESAEAVVVVPASAAFVDAALLDGMIAHHAEIAESMRMTFAPAPPGLAGLVVRPDLLDELATAGVGPGHLLAYRPGDSRGDYLNRPFCYQTPSSVAHASFRLLADTDRALTTMRAFLSRNGDSPADGFSAEDVCRWWQENAPPTDALPREVEIELTTDDQLHDTLLRPRGDRVPRRGPIRVETVANLARELRRFDDSLVVLGGFGEPLMHPEFEAILNALRPNRSADGDGIFGLAVRTNGLSLDDRTCAMLADHSVDLVVVTLDAHTRETYLAAHRHDGFQTARDRLEQFLRWRHDHRRVLPIPVPELMKSRETFGDMEVFYDHWVSRLGAAVIRGYSHHAGQCEDRAVMNMAPPHRGACRRLSHRCMVLADGVVTACDQDFAGRMPLGDLSAESLATIWTGRLAGQLRNAHATGRLDAIALCSACDEWHRP